MPLNVDTIRDAPKVLLHDHLDGGLRPATVIELADAAGYRDLPTTDADELGGWFLGRGALRVAGALPGDVRAHRRGDADARTRWSGWPPSARRTSPPTASSTPRCGSPPSCTSSAGLELDAVVEAVLEGFRRRRRARPPSAGAGSGSAAC